MVDWPQEQVKQSLKFGGENVEALGLGDFGVYAQDGLVLLKGQSFR